MMSKYNCPRGEPSCTPNSWPRPTPNRVEDGGGLVSTAVWHVPQSQDFFKCCDRGGPPNCSHWIASSYPSTFCYRVQRTPIVPGTVVAILEDIKYTLGQSMMLIGRICWRLNRANLFALNFGNPFYWPCRTLMSLSFLSSNQGCAWGSTNVIPPSPLWPQQPLNNFR